MSFQDKVAVVTGSSRGIGRGIALDLAKQGCRVLVHGSRPSEQLDRTFEAVASHSGQSIKVSAALSDSAEIDQMFQTVRSTFGRVDILVNNAATQNPCPLLELKEDDWDLVLAVNLKAPFLCAQHAGWMMRDQGGGKIVNISSVHAYDAKRNFAHYSSSKGGLETLTKSMALELAAYNIQVNSLVVGAIATDMTPVERQQKFLTAVPAGRVGTVDEIARMVTFVVSDACDYLTGASIRVDGGLTLGFCQPARSVKEKMLMEFRLTGLVAATYTPMHGDGSLNLGLVPSIIDYLVNQKISALYVCGSTGEGPSLSTEEREATTAAYVSVAAGRIPVLVQVGHASLTEARRLAAHAKQIGADAISATSPYYFKPDSVEVLVSCLAEITEAAPEVPFYYYHIPRLTGIELNMLDLLRIAPLGCRHWWGSSIARRSLTSSCNASSLTAGDSIFLLDATKCCSRGWPQVRGRLWGPPTTIWRR